MSLYGLKSTLKLQELIVYGTNTIEDLGDYAKKFGKRGVLIYGGTSLVKSGNHERILHILKRNKIEFSEIRGITHDPDDELVKTITASVVDINPDFIIGVGGGSVMDTAKAASIIATNGGEVKDYWGGRVFTKPSIPYIAVPTTSGTGSEVTKNAVTAYTGLDALIQNLEAFTSKNSGPITDTFAHKGIKLSGKYLLQAVRNPDNLKAREGLSLSSLYGGITLLNAGLGLAHGLSHPLGIRFGIPHGKACAIVMAKVMEYNYPARKDKYDEIGMLLFGMKNGIEAFKKLMDMLEISTKLGNYGVKKKDITVIVAESRGGSRSFNPIEHSDNTVAQMLQELL